MFIETAEKSIMGRMGRDRLGGKCEVGVVWAFSYYSTTLSTAPSEIQPYSISRRTADRSWGSRFKSAYALPPSRHTRSCDHLFIFYFAFEFIDHRKLGNFFLSGLSRQRLRFAIAATHEAQYGDYCRLYHIFCSEFLVPLLRRHINICPTFGCTKTGSSSLHPDQCP